VRVLSRFGFWIAAVVLAAACVDPAWSGWRIADYGYFEFRPTESRPESVAAGDLTGDGRDDVLLVARNDSSRIDLILYTQQVNGTLAAPVTVETTLGGPGPVGVALGDLDGDDRLEAVIGGFEVAVFRQFAGSLMLAERYPAWPFAATGIGIGDLDSDGRNDIVYGGQIGHTPPPEASVMALMNRGDRFESRQLLNGFRAGDIEVGDVTGDGRTDIVTHTWNSPAAVTLLEQLHGGAYRHRELNVAWVDHHVGVGSVAIGDLTGDGFADIAFSAANRVGVLSQSPRGTYSRALLYPTFNGAGALEAGDVNHDGRVDLAGLGGARWSYFLQMPHGRLAPPEEFDMPNASTDRWSLALADFTGDGLLDLAAAVWGYGYEDGLVLNPQYGGPRASDHLPQTWITAWPGYQTAETTATFEFTSSEHDATYLCFLDGRSVRPCTSPLTFELSAGSHQFDVLATDRFGNSDPSYASWSWHVAGWGMDQAMHVLEGPDVGPGGTPSPAEEPQPAPPTPTPPSPPPQPPPAVASPAAAGGPQSGTRVEPSDSARTQGSPRSAGSRSRISVASVLPGPRRVGRRGVVLIPLVCRSRPDTGRCRGRLQLVRSRKVLGRASFSLRPSARRVVPVKLNAYAMKQLLRRRSLSVRAVTRLTGGLTSARFITLRAAAGLTPPK
jgi:FG-GAP-like repeat